MAKGKHSVALFEVIQSDSRFKRSAPSNALKTPSWWFKRSAAEASSKPRGVYVEAKQPVAEAPCKQPAMPARPASAHQAAATHAPGPSLLEYAEKILTNLQRQAQARLDRTKLSPSLTPLSGVLAACVMIVCVLIGRHFTHHVQSVDAGIVSTEALRDGPAHPEVLNVYDAGTPGSAAAVGKSTELLVDRNDSQTAPNAPQQASSVLPAATAPARQINLNYVLMQSYADEKLADQACAFLNKNGVPCTIERGVKNWRKDFYLVIGEQGFVRASGPDYVAYRKRIEALSGEFARPGSYKGFMPQAIKWDRN